MLANSALYTADSIDLLQQAYDGVVYNYNIFYQSAVDTMASNIQKAIDNMEYVDADYSVVTNAIDAADVSAIVNYIHSNADKTFTYNGNTASYYTADFVSSVDAAAQAIEDAKSAVVYGLDISHQDEVNAYAAAITDAYNAFAAIGADYTATLAIKNYAMGMKASNYSNFNAVRTAANRVRANYGVLRQEEVDAMASDIATAIENLILKPATKTALADALALTPEYAQAYYTAESYNAWATLVAEGQAMYNDATLTILDNDAINAKAAAITDAFNALALDGANKAPLADALALTPSYAESFYTAESYGAWSALVTEGQAMYADDTLTGADNAAIVEKANAITTAFNALTPKAADKTALATALALVPDYAEANYTEGTYSAWTTLVTEGQAMYDDATLTVLDNEAVAAKAAAITDAYNALEVIDTGYTFEVADGSEAVIDTENGFIYGLEEGITNLDGVIAYEGCTVAITETDNGFGTGTKVEVVYRGEVVETYYIVIFGDVTGDGFIDNFDVAALSTVANYETEFDDNSPYAFAGDLTGDGFIDSFDCVMLISASNYETTIPQK